MQGLQRCEKDGIVVYVDVDLDDAYPTLLSAEIMTTIPLYFFKKYKSIKIGDDECVLASDLFDIALDAAIELKNYSAAVFANQCLILGAGGQEAPDIKPEKAMQMCQRMYATRHPEIVKTQKKKEQKAKETVKKAKSPEYCHQLKLQKKHGGQIEVKAKHGRIDLLTDSHLIEIKDYYCWKAAIGQLMAYSSDYPEHIKVLALFNVPSQANLPDIKHILAALDIELWILND